MDLDQSFLDTLGQLSSGDVDALMRYTKAINDAKAAEIDLKARGIVLPDPEERAESTDQMSMRAAIRFWAEDCKRCASEGRQCTPCYFLNNPCFTDEEKEHMRGSRIIMAVKLFRSRTGVDLVESKNIITAWRYIV